MDTTNGETRRACASLANELTRRLGLTVAGEIDSPNSTLDDESSRLKESLSSCRKLIANYRAMLTDSSNDNAPDENEGETA